MENKKEGPQAAAPSKSSKLNPNTKRATVLRAFIGRGVKGLNCFEAVRVAHDYVLRSTVSDLYRDYGFSFARKWEKVPGHAGSQVDCVRYWLSPESRRKACDMLGVPDHQNGYSDSMGAVI